MQSWFGVGIVAHNGNICLFEYGMPLYVGKKEKEHQKAYNFRVTGWNTITENTRWIQSLSLQGPRLPSSLINSTALEIYLNTYSGEDVIRSGVHIEKGSRIVHVVPKSDDPCTAPIIAADSVRRLFIVKIPWWLPGLKICPSSTPLRHRKIMILVEN